LRTPLACGSLRAAALELEPRGSPPPLAATRAPAARSAVLERALVPVFHRDAAPDGRRWGGARAEVERRPRSALDPISMIDRGRAMERGRHPRSPSATRHGA